VTLPTAAGQREVSIEIERVSGEGQASIWHGTIDDDSLSDLTLVASRQSVVGALTTLTLGSYRIRPDRSGQTVIERIDRGKLLKNETPPLEECGRQSVPSKVTCENRPYDIDAVVVYNQGARDWANSRTKETIEQWIRLAEDRTNEAFQQSTVSHRLRVTAMELVNYTKQPTGQDDLKALVNGTHGLQAAHALRETRGADILVLVTDSSMDPLACPLDEDAVGTKAYENSAMAVVGVERLSAGDAFTHEVGHILGAGHANPRGAYEFSRPWCGGVKKTCDKWRSIMVTNYCQDYAPLLRFSSQEPSGCDSQQQMGSCDYDNGRTIEKTGCTVAGYRERGDD